MAARALLGAVLLVAGIAAGIYGHNHGQPTTEEKIVSGALLFAEALGEGNKKDREKLHSEQVKRAIPFYVIAGVSSALGIALLVISVRGPN